MKVLFLLSPVLFGGFTLLLGETFRLVWSGARIKKREHGMVLTSSNKRRS